MRTEKDWSNYLIFGTPLPPAFDDDVPMPERTVSLTQALEWDFRPKANKCLVCGDIHGSNDLGCDDSDYYE